MNKWFIIRITILVLSFIVGIISAFGTEIVRFSLFTTWFQAIIAISFFLIAPTIVALLHVYLGRSPECIRFLQVKCKRTSWKSNLLTDKWQQIYLYSFVCLSFGLGRYIIKSYILYVNDNLGQVFILMGIGIYVAIHICNKIFLKEGKDVD